MAWFKSNQPSNSNFLDLQIASGISHSDNLNLIKIPSMTEVKQSVFSIDSTKTPDLDGFGVGFSKHYWNLIKNDFYQCISKFFTRGKMLRQINHTFVALIPKRENPSETQHFRLVSLCNTVYKTISKIIVNRLRPLLDKLVS